MAKMWDQSGKKIPRYDPGVNINDKHILDTIAIDSLFSFFYHGHSISSYIVPSGK